MKTKSKIKTLAAAAMVIGACFILYSGGFLGSSRERIARDHSLSLPASAARVHCDGPVSITAFGDFEAGASFEIEESDLPALLSQVNWDTTVEMRNLVFFKKRMTVPDRYSKLTSSNYGMSSDGNRIFLQTYDLGDSRLGVCVYTLWN